MICRRIERALLDADEARKWTMEDSGVKINTSKKRSKRFQGSGEIQVAGGRPSKIEWSTCLR